MQPNWDSLLNVTSLAAVLPAEYAHFARPIHDGLIVFLSGLPEADQADVLRAQAALPLTATFSQRLGRLAQCCPVLHKLGQILARDQRLPLDLRQQLWELESLPPSVPQETVERILAAELGPLDRRGVTLAPPAIAEASVAVVIPFHSRDSLGGRQTAVESGGGLAPAAARGVFKVLKPGIEERLERELELLRRVGEHLDQRCDELLLPQLDYEDAFEQVRDKLADEVKLEHEQRHLVEASAFFADEPRVQIPRLLAHCTRRVTAMERVSGGKVTGRGLAGPRGKCRLAALVAQALIAKPVFSRTHQAMFHGDPHAGNLFLTDDGRLAILDWSLVGRIGEPERVALVQLMLAAVTLDAKRIVAVLAPLGDSRLDRTALESVVAGWLRRIRRGQFPGLSWVIGLLDDATQTARLRVGGDLMLFRKSLHTLEGVVADVGESSGQIDKVLSLEFLRHFALEWPLRWTHWPDSRACATRLSNLDLTRTWLSYPAAATRFWAGHVNDMLDVARQRFAAAGPPVAAVPNHTVKADSKFASQELTCP